MGNKLSCCLSQIREIKRMGKTEEESILNVIEELKKTRKDGNFTFNTNRIFLDNKEKYIYIVNKLNENLYECVSYYIDYDNF